MSIRRYHCDIFLGYRLHAHFSGRLNHLLDMCRCCSTASADHVRSHLYDLSHISGKLFRFYVIIDFSVTLLRKPCIRLHNNRNRCIFQNILQDRKHLFRSHAAVNTKCIHTESFQHRNYCRNISSCQEFSFFIKDHGHKYRKRSILLCSKNCCFHFIAVTHSLDMDQVSACLLPIDHCFFKCVICVFKRKITHWF